MNERKRDEQALKELRRLLQQIQEMLERTREKIEDLERRLAGGKADPPPSQGSLD